LVQSASTSGGVRMDYYQVQRHARSVFYRSNITGNVDYSVPSESGVEEGAKLRMDE
jgi:hypothetical protein